MSTTTQPIHPRGLPRPKLASSLLLLRCLGILPLLSIAVAQTTETKALRSSDAPASRQITQPQIEELLAALDAQFARGDYEQYIATFRPDHQGAMAMLGRHLRRLCAITGQNRSRSSKVLGDLMVYADRTVVRVRHIIEWPQDAGREAAQPGRLVEDSYLAVRRDADGKIVPTFAIEMPTQVDCVAERKFHCPPCNYEIGGVPGFLCVPLRRERALALEAASFYLVGTDVVCDVHVLIPSTQQAAVSSALKLASAFREIEQDAVVSLPTKWEPPTQAGKLPADVDSARVVVDLPSDHPESGGIRTIFHVVQFGGLQHILLVRSTTKSLRKHQAAVDSLLGSYMLLKTDCDGGKISSLPLRHHTGGAIEGHKYSNDRYGIGLVGPESWRAEHRVGGSMFRVHWTSPNGSQMWLIGHRVPTGMDAWTTKTADRWLSHQHARNHLTPDASKAVSDAAKWRRGPDNSWSRSCVLLGTDKDSPDNPARRLVQVQVHKDLLLIVDGFGVTAADEEALRAASQTLRRR